MSLRPTAKSRAKARAKRAEPGRAEWKASHTGVCAGCHRRGPVIRHHVVTEQRVRALGGDPWDLDNAMDLGRWCRCHADHHAPNGLHKLPLRKVPQRAVQFTARLMGEDVARTYLAAYYAA